MHFVKDSFEIRNQNPSLHNSVLTNWSNGRLCMLPKPASQIKSPCITTAAGDSEVGHKLSLSVRGF